MVLYIASTSRELEAGRRELWGKERTSYLSTALVSFSMSCLLLERRGDGKREREGGIRESLLME